MTAGGGPEVRAPGVRAPEVRAPEVRALWRRRVAGLVPASPAPGRWELVLAVVVGVATSVVFLVRQPGSAVDSPWAEDGRVFLGGAYADGWSAVLRPYAGYLHVYARLAAIVAARLPVRDAAAVLAVAGALAAGLMAATAVLATAAWVRSVELRAVLGLTLVLFPFGASEIAANVANSHWFFLAGAALTLVWRTTWRPATAWTVALALLASLTDPLAGLLLPLALVRLLAGPVPPAAGTAQHRSPRTRQWWGPVAPVVALVTGLAFQVVPVVTTFSAVRAPGSVHPALRDLTREFLRRVPATVLIGEAGARHAGRGLLVGTGVVVVLAVAAVALRRPLLVPAVLAGLGYVAVFWFLPVRLRNTDQDPAVTLAALARNARYSTVSVVLLLVVLFAGIDALVGAGHRRVARLLAAGTLVWVLATQLPTVGAGVVRAPSWDGGLVAAQARCRTGRVLAVDVPISPARWLTRVPCDRLR